MSICCASNKSHNGHLVPCYYNPPLQAAGTYSFVDDNICETVVLPDTSSE